MTSKPEKKLTKYETGSIKSLRNMTASSMSDKRAKLKDNIRIYEAYLVREKARWTDKDGKVWHDTEKLKDPILSSIYRSLCSDMYTLERLCEN